MTSSRIVYASSPTSVSMSDAWYDIASLDHFWIRRRFQVLRALADGVIRKAENIAEVGCGNGLLQRSIEDCYGVPVAGFDLNDLALRKNMSRQSDLYCYDVHQRSPEFQARFDLVFLFDVLEHISAEDAFLDSLRHLLTPAGALLINVPAHQSLYSAYDRAAGHIRRYSLAYLTEVARRNNFTVRTATYWGLPLVPLLMARKALLLFQRKEQNIIRLGFDSRGKISNHALSLLSRCEILPQRLFGTSLMALIENQP
jgi:2-polyprenyl-3-methyl-5-hydroxy-6-metoxy-1,4-benzoquinol methylase